MKRLIIYMLLAVVAGGQMAAQYANNTYFMNRMPYRHELNPAFASEHDYVGIPVLTSIHVGANGNVGAGNFLFPRDGELVTGLNEKVSAAEFLDGLKNTNYLEANVKLNVIDFGFKAFGGYNTFGLNVRSMTGISVPYELLEFAKVGQIDGSPTSYVINDLKVSSSNFVELALGHSRVIAERWRVGAKVKYLAGVGRVEAAVDRMDIAMSEDRWTVRNSGRMFRTGVLDIRYKENGEIDDADYGKVGVDGNGFGIDLGVEWSPIENLRVSASLTDIGFVSWNGSEAAVDNKEFVYDGFHHLVPEKDPVTGESPLKQEADQLEEDLKELIRFGKETAASQMQSLPTTLRVGGEYGVLGDKISFGLLSTTRFCTPKTWAELMASVNFRPASWFHATVNGSTSNLGHALGMALNFCPRRFNFFLGADYIPLKYGKQGIPVSVAKVNFTLGMTITFN